MQRGEPDSPTSPKLSSANNSRVGDGIKGVGRGCGAGGLAEMAFAVVLASLFLSSTMTPTAVATVSLVIPL